MAGVAARATSATVVASSAVTSYAQAALAVELEHRFGRIAAVASVEAGWSTGVIAKAQGTEVVSLAGGVAIASIGARWR